MTTVEVLRAARELIARPGGWTQGYYNRGDGSFCAGGALRTVLRGLGAYYTSDARGYMLRVVLPYESVGAWNDATSRSQAEVVAAFDAAINLAEQEGVP